MFACEAAAAPARGLPARVLQTDALVVAVAQTYVRAYGSGAVVSGLTLTFEVTRFGYKQTVRVRIAMHFLAAGFARIRALRLACLSTNIDIVNSPSILYRASLPKYLIQNRIY